MPARVRVYKYRYISGPYMLASVFGQVHLCQGCRTQRSAAPTVSDPRGSRCWTHVGRSNSWRRRLRRSWCPLLQPRPLKDESKTSRCREINCLLILTYFLPLHPVPHKLRKSTATRHTEHKFCICSAYHCSFYLLFFSVWFQAEIMRLIASNDRLKTTNKAREFDVFPSTTDARPAMWHESHVFFTLYLSLKDLENNINMVLSREKASKAIRRYMLHWT